MSYYGRQWLELYGRQEAKIEADYWERHAECLTAEERQRIASGNHSALRRPVKPDMRPGQWLRVGPKVEIRVAGLSFRGNAHIVQFDGVRDLRGGGRATNKRIREDLSIVTTLDVGPDVHHMGEPEKVPARIVEGLTYASRRRYELEQAQLRLAYEALPVSIRLTRLTQEAERAGIDITRQLARIDQAVKAAEAKVRRISPHLASDKAA